MVRAPGPIGVSHFSGVRATLLLLRGTTPSDVAREIEHENDDCPF